MVTFKPKFDVIMNLAGAVQDEATSYAAVKQPPVSFHDTIGYVCMHLKGPEVRALYDAMSPVCGPDRFVMTLCDMITGSLTVVDDVYVVIHRAKDAVLETIDERATAAWSLWEEDITCMGRTIAAPLFNIGVRERDLTKTAAYIAMSGKEPVRTYVASVAQRYTGDHTDL